MNNFNRAHTEIFYGLSKLSDPSEGIQLSDLDSFLTSRLKYLNLDDPADVCEFFNNRNLSEFCPNVLAHKFTAHDLLEVLIPNQGDIILQEIGIAKLLDRKRIMRTTADAIFGPYEKQLPHSVFWKLIVFCFEDIFIPVLSIIFSYVISLAVIKHGRIHKVKYKFFKSAESKERCEAAKSQVPPSKLLHDDVSVSSEPLKRRRSSPRRLSSGVGKHRATRSGKYLWKKVKRKFWQESKLNRLVKKEFEFDEMKDCYICGKRKHWFKHLCGRCSRVVCEKHTGYRISACVYVVQIVVVSRLLFILYCVILKLVANLENPVLVRVSRLLSCNRLDPLPKL
eukprot:snap_masked-scaffold_72-processed-gene-0.31-mRNA-1 protein AED:1.00 eAED:1.00 QI:0/0/0/0/1/1/2/0/337